MQGTEKIAKTIDKYIKLYNTPPYGREIDGTVELLAKCKEIICSCVDAGWIPVEERLPEVGECVLGTNQYNEVLIYHYGWNSPHTRKMFFHLCGAAATIIAWQPLPKPYRLERSES